MNTFEVKPGPPTKAERQALRDRTWRHRYPTDGAGYCANGCGAWFSTTGLKGHQPAGVDPLGQCPQGASNVS